MVRKHVAEKVKELTSCYAQLSVDKHGAFLKEFYDSITDVKVSVIEEIPYVTVYSTRLLTDFEKTEMKERVGVTVRFVTQPPTEEEAVEDTTEYLEAISQANINPLKLTIEDKIDIVNTLFPQDQLDPILKDVVNHLFVTNFPEGDFQDEIRVEKAVDKFVAECKETLLNQLELFKGVM